MNSDDLIMKVRQLINEPQTDYDVTLLSADTRSLDDSIIGLLPQAVAFIQQNKGAGTGCVNAKSVAPTALSVVADVSGGGMLPLPDDFVALVSLQLFGWMAPAHVLYPHDSREAVLQRNEYTRAGSCRPVCVEGFAADGSRCILLFPFSATDYATPISFIYEARFNPAEGLNMYDDRMVDAVVYKCVSLLYTMFERYDAANSYLTLAMAACGGQMNKK